MKPILVPLSLDLLLEEGILPTDWPHTDNAFDASGAWTHSFSTHGSHGYKGDKSSFNGSMRISRRLTGKTQQLMVTRNVAHTGRTILTDGFKYTVDNDDSTALLFDLHNDPSETENLAGKPAHAETVSEYHALITKWESRLDCDGERLPEGAGRAGRLG